MLLPKVMSTSYDIWSTHKILIEADQSVRACPPRTVWLDGHAYGGDLDHIYHHLFGSGVHIRRLAPDNETLMFKRAVFIENTSPFWEGLALYNYDHPCQNNSGLHQFRDFVLKRYGVKQKELSVKTNETKRLTFLVRKDYQPHPRSDGRTDRQVEDIEGDANYLRKQYPDYQLDIVSFEAMSFSEQLRSVARTDLFVAIHGAGNMHAMFLPTGATFHEYFPPGFKGRTRFKFLSHCLGIKYESRTAVIKRKFKGGKVSVSISSGFGGEGSISSPTSAANWPPGKHSTCAKKHPRTTLKTELFAEEQELFTRYAQGRTSYLGNLCSYISQCYVGKLIIINIECTATSHLQHPTCSPFDPTYNIRITKLPLGEGYPSFPSVRTLFKDPPVNIYITGVRTNCKKIEYPSSKQNQVRECRLYDPKSNLDTGQGSCASLRRRGIRLSS